MHCELRNGIFLVACLNLVWQKKEMEDEAFNYDKMN